MSVDVASETNLSEELILDEETAAALFLQARTANTWADETISAETLQAIYALTRMGPTAMNIQPLRITWVSSPEARQRLVSHMNDGNKEKTLGAPMAAVLSYDTDWHQTLATTTPHMAERADRFGENDSLRQNMAANNAHIQAGYFIVAARAAGLAAGPMTGFDAAGVDKEFFAGSSRHAFLVVNLGRPSTDEPRPRLPRLGSEVATETI